MSTKRQVIDSLRNKLRERNADSNYTNQFLYQTLVEQAKWLIKRELGAGRIWRNNSVFQTFLVEIIETSVIDACLDIKTKCKIYRSKNKLPDMWISNDGPILRSVSSVDGSTDFFYTSSMIWQNKRNNPYQKKSGMKYSFFSEGYLWLPEHNPRYVKVEAFYLDDVRLIKDKCIDCDKEEDCIKFLDTNFMIPDWCEAEMMAKAVELLAGVSKRLPEDEQIDKNPTRKS